MAAMILSNAAVSSSTRARSLFITACPLSAQSENSFHLASQPALCEERFATMVPRAAASAPIYAEIDPPPGAGDSEAVSYAKSLHVILTSLSRAAVSAGSSIRNSTTFSRGSNGLRSSSPMDFTAIFIISSSEIPVERCCFSRK